MITKEEREWIENQLKANGLTGQAAQKFTAESIDYFTRLRKQPRKQDFATINFAEIIPNMPEHLRVRRIK
jgi:phage regulator Rha-like protein